MLGVKPKTLPNWMSLGRISFVRVGQSGANTGFRDQPHHHRGNAAGARGEMSPESQGATDAPIKRGRGDFFAVDRRTWAALL